MRGGEGRAVGGRNRKTGVDCPCALGWLLERWHGDAYLRLPGVPIARIRFSHLAHACRTVNEGATSSFSVGLQKTLFRLLLISTIKRGSDLPCLEFQSFVYAKSVTSVANFLLLLTLHK